MMKSLAVFILGINSLCVASFNRTKVSIGLLTHESSYMTTAAATTEAIKQAQSQGLVQDVDFKVTWRDDGCLGKKGVAAAVQLYTQENVDVFMGPICSDVCLAVGFYASYWNIPMISHGSSDPELQDKQTYDTLMRVRPSYDKIGYAFKEIMRHFRWSLVGMITSDFWQCDFGARSVLEHLKQNNITMTEWAQTDDTYSDQKIGEVLQKISERARIIILCTRTENMWRYVDQARRRGMTDGDYVFFYYALLPSEFIVTPWAGEDISEEERKAYHVFKMVTMDALSGDKAENLMNLTMQKMLEPPWSISSYLLEGRTPSVQAILLYDATKIYLDILDQFLKAGEDFRDGKKVFNKTKARTFNGATGTITFDDNGDREPDFLIWHYSESHDQFVEWTTISMLATEGQRLVPESEAYWTTKNGKPPPDRPACGFRNEFCPLDNTARDVVIACLTTIGLLVCLAIGGFCYLYRRRKFEEELDQMLWRIKYEDIRFTSMRNAGSMMSLKSTLSLLSHRSSQSPGTTSVSCQNSPRPGRQQQIFTKVGSYKGIIVAVKEIQASTVTLRRKDHLELKAMRELSHDNVIPFVGACIDPPNVCILTVYCSKGSLEDILGNDEINLDWMFKCSLMSDLANGLVYLHCSPLKSHGNLSSSMCLVDSRWLLKISGYGTHAIRRHAYTGDVGDYKRYKKLLWTAPELLRMPNRPPEGTVKGDVYSFGIILQEIVYRSLPFFLEMTQPKDVVERVREGFDPPYRPVLPKPKDNTERKAVKLMTECWSEDPNARPDFKKILQELRAMQGGRKLNIMDTMLNKLEKYATNLEEIVAQRTGELVEEKKKTDSLLYRMLPPTVAESLKLGKTVEAEMYDAVTVFFSDIVGFTQLSSESTPMQVVDLLNDLYTMCDDTIQLHDVYKVETIGDAYMVVSGLPRRNGNKHVAEIANMALDLLSEVADFKVRHRPDIQLRLRIGIHTGPCAAGVVGLTMPRYCLFGDTVNMASRMESSGEALKIHLSSQAYDALVFLHNGYWVVPRGEMDIKGKGLQKTFWLVGKEGYNKELPAATVNP